MTSAPTSEALSEALTHACNIADQLAGDYAVVLYDATYPAGRDPDRPTPVRPRPPAGNPDYVKGARFDSGVGDQRGKDACAQAAGHLVAARRLADRAVTDHGGHRPVSGTRRPIRGAVEFRGAVFAVVGRFRWLLGHDAVHGTADVRRQAHGAAVHFLEAHAAVRGVMRDFKDVREPTADRRCWNCGRAAVYAATRECEACSKYRRRVEAQIRAGRTPKHRFRPVPRYQEAYDAMKRREARLLPGQLDIESPLPAVRYVDGQPERSTPHPDNEPRREAS